jgi:hypothetical protein
MRLIRGHARMFAERPYRPDTRLQDRSGLPVWKRFGTRVAPPPAMFQS